MYQIKRTGAFKKDLKVVISLGYKIGLLEAVVNALANGEALDEK